MIPLSVNQEALWVSWQLDRDAFMDVVVTPYEVRGAVDTARLGRAIEALGERFPVLRGVIRSGDDGSPVLTWDGQPPLRLRQRSLDGESMDDALRATTRVALDLENGPPCHFELLSGDGGTVLVLTVPHLMYDGLSIPNLLAALRAAYRGEPLGAPDDIADIAEFNRWQHELANAPAGAEHRAFWRDHLGADAPVLELPTGPDASGRFEMLDAELEPALVDRVRAVAKDLGLTATMVLYAAYLVLLRRHTGQDELVVSMSTHGRHGRPRLAGAVGFFSNAIPIRQRLSSGDTYAGVTRRLHADARRCIRFADLPRPAIVRAAGMRDTAVVDAAIFQYWNSTTRPDVDLADFRMDDGCSLRMLPLRDVAGYRLQPLFREDRDRVLVSWKDTRGELGRGVLDMLAKDYHATLTEFVADPARPIGAARPARHVAEQRLVMTGRAMLDQLHPDEPGDDHPSPHQERMAFVDRFETGVVYDGPPVYHNVPLVRLLPSVPSRVDLADRFARIVASHKVLRTNVVFTQDGFRLRVQPGHDPEVTWLDEAADARAWIDTPFDLAGDALIRLAVQPRPDGRAWLVLAGHQAVVDRNSLRLVAGWLTSGTLPPAHSPWPDRDLVARDLAAVADRLRGDIEPVQLPERRHRDAVHVYQEDAVALTLPVTGQAQLLAGFAAVLSWYTGQDELVIGTTQPATTAAVGPLSNLVPVRLRTSVSVAFEDLAAEAEAELAFARTHREAPFDDLVRVLDPGKDMSRTALFDVLFSHIDEPDDGLTADEALLGSGAGKYDLHLAARPRDGETQARLVFNARYFDREQFEDFGVHMARLLAQAAARPGITLGELTPITVAERDRQLTTWNDTAAAYPRITLTELVRQAARKSPDAIAITEGDTNTTYRELFAAAETMARGLVAAGVRPGELVGLHLGRGTSQVTAIMAVLLAGAGYLPIDPDIPFERKQFTLADARVDVLLTDSDLPVDSVLVLRPENLTGDGPLPEITPDSVAYCIYTSGTTGQPKGVVISHRNVVRLLANDRFGFRFGADDVWTLFHAYHFDFSVWEMFGCLAYGGRLVVVSVGEARDTERFAEVLRRERVTVLNQTPGAFQQLVAVAGRLPDLRYVIFGGDRLDTAKLAGWAAAHPDAHLVNMYGITEVTVHATAHTITARDVGSGRSIVGRPLPTTQVHVLDRRTGDRLLPTGAVGEVYVGGLGTAKGYLRRPALSAERFVPSPFDARDLLFRSGDLGRWWPDGTLEVVGRADAQIKLRGYRIEPGEIESCLRRHDAVSQAVVLLENGSDGYLAAFVQAARPIRDSELRAHLATQLPAYMVPARFHVLRDIPLTSNGKVDVRALSRLAAESGPDGTAPAAELSGTARTIAQAWQELLGVTDLTAQSSFFDLGGHSLQAAKLLARLSPVAGVQLPLRLLFEHPRLADLAAAIDAMAQPPGAAPEPVPAPQAGSDLPASGFQERIYLAERVDPEAHRYLVPLLWRVSGAVDTGRLAAALAALVRRHEIFRTRFEIQDGRLRQIVGEPWQPRVKVHATDDLDGWLRARLAEPFDLSSGRLLDCALVSVNGSDVLVLLVHHLAWDLASAQPLLHELGHYYESGVDLPAPGQYRDFVAAQRQYADGPGSAADLAYWASSLRDAPAYVSLPTPWRAGSPGAVRVELPADLAQRLTALQTNHGVSWFMAAATALFGVLHRFTGSDDVTVGVTVDNRDETPDLIGPCLNAVVLRSRTSAGTTVRDLLANARETVLSALEHKTVPFEAVIDHLNPPRRAGWTPYADVMLNVNAGTGTSGRLGDTRLTPFTVDSQWEYDTKFGITVTVTESTDGLGATLAYRGDRIAAEDARQLAVLFGRLLTMLPDALDTALATVDLVTPDDLPRLLELESGPPAAPPASVPALLRRRITEFGDRPAIQSSTGELTYAQLDQRIAAMAARLRSVARTSTHSPVVALVLGRGESLVVAQLAAWRAQFAYCPIDPDYPPERIRFMLDDLHAVAAVTDQPDTAELAARCGIPVVHPADVPGDVPGDVTAEVRHVPEVLPDPDSPACLIYTSGTTGQPKGSVWRHRGIAQLARWHVDTMAVTENDRASLLASVGFDGAQWELWPYLIAGACVLPYERRIAVPEVVEWLDRTEITMCFMPTPLAEVLVAGRRQPRTLRWLTMGGTTFTTRLPPDATYRVCNAYGPSENTVVGSVLLIDRDNTLPVNDVGRPIQGTSVSLVDAAGQRVPRGVPGEILLGGVAVADGYWRRPELTAERFLPGPWYRTGDQARWSAEGHLQFLGREDRQLKIRGYRIEPQEIEVALQADPLVRQALVAGFPGSTPSLVGYVVPADSGTDSTDDGRDTGAVVRRLAERLPSFMVPDALVWLAELPTSVHGKLETSALPPAGRADLVRRQGDAAAPRTDLEHTVAGVWAEVLKLDEIGTDDNFFDLGGNSLLLSTLHARLETALARPIGIHLLFEYPTIRGLARYIGTPAPAASDAPDPILARARRARAVRRGGR